MARTHWWKWLLEEGGYASIAEIAEAEKIDRSFVNRLLRLTLLGSDIQEAIRGLASKGNAAGGVDAGDAGGVGGAAAVHTTQHYRMNERTNRTMSLSSLVDAEMAFTENVGIEINQTCSEA